MGPAQCPCLLRQREFPGRLRNGRFFESLPAMGTLPAPFGERFDAASAACAGRLAQRPAAPLLPQSRPDAQAGPEGFSAAARDMSTSAAAPSEIVDAFAAVTVPSSRLKAGLPAAAGLGLCWPSLRFAILTCDGFICCCPPR